MKAQTLYDLREEFEFCSGTELHEFFRKNAGDPSPSGNTEISFIEANEFLLNAITTIEQNSSIDMSTCLSAWRVCLSKINLSEADLTEANLTGADLRKYRMEVDFEQINCSFATFQAAKNWVEIILSAGAEIVTIWHDNKVVAAYS